MRHPEIVATIDDVRVAVYTIPTDAPESDGTLEWDSTTLVLVEVSAGGHYRLGFSYADTATAVLIRDRLAALVAGSTPIIGLEPSCLAAFRDELVNFFPGNENAMRLSHQTFTLSEFLQKIDYRPPPLTRHALMHGHCHHRAIMPACSSPPFRSSCSTPVLIRARRRGHC